jgi:hypothetical protein
LGGDEDLDSGRQALRPSRSPTDPPHPREGQRLVQALALTGTGNGDGAPSFLISREEDALSILVTYVTIPSFSLLTK